MTCRLWVMGEGENKFITSGKMLQIDVDLNCMSNRDLQEDAWELSSANDFHNC